MTKHCEICGCPYSSIIEWWTINGLCEKCSDAPWRDVPAWPTPDRKVFGALRLMEERILWGCSDPAPLPGGRHYTAIFMDEYGKIPTTKREEPMGQEVEERQIWQLHDDQAWAKAGASFTILGPGAKSTKDKPTWNVGYNDRDLKSHSSLWIHEHCIFCGYQAKEVKAGQTWEVREQWEMAWERGQLLLTIGRHPNNHSKMIVDTGRNYRSAGVEQIQKRCRLVQNEKGEPVVGKAKHPVADKMAQYEVKIGQVREDGAGHKYDIVGRSRRGLRAWVVEWHGGAGLGKKGNIAIRYDNLIEDERGDPPGKLHKHNCKKCGVEFEAFGTDAYHYDLCLKCFNEHVDPEDREPEVEVECLECGATLEAHQSKYCQRCAENITTCRYCGRDYEKTEGACGRCHNVKVKCITCGKVFEGPPAACGPCYGQQALKLEDAERRFKDSSCGLREARKELAETKGKVCAYARKANMLGNALRALGFVGWTSDEVELEKHLEEFIKTFPGYSIGADMGSGKSQTVIQDIKPPAPAKKIFATTEVTRREDGQIRMDWPDGEGSTPVKQGTGLGGLTCEGFQFKEDSDTVYPSAIGWVRPSNPVHVSMCRVGSFTEETRAIRAIWNRREG